MIRAEFETKLLGAVIQRWSRELKLSPGVVIRDEARLLTRDLIRLTPPTGDDDSTPRKQGEKAVRRDILRALNPLDPRKWKSRKIKKLIRERNYSLLQEALRHMKMDAVHRHVVVGPFNPDIHQKMRDRRGRVKERKFAAYATPDFESVEAYIKRKQANVGMAKGGWASVAAKLGTRVPAWVARHNNQGTFVDQTNRDSRAFIEMTNNSRWGQSGFDERIFRQAIRQREAAILKKLERRALESAKKQGL